MIKQARSEYFDFEIAGDFAMFLSPASKLSCEWFSYQFPTYSSLIGILKNIYSFPSVEWHIEKVRVMNRIQYTSMPIRSPQYYGDEVRARYNHTFLYDVRYQVRAYYTIDWAADHRYCNWDHGVTIMKRLQNGHNITTLGKNDCIGFTTPCVFGDGTGYYDDIDEVIDKFMFFRFINNMDIDGEMKAEITESEYGNYRMINGVIDFSNIVLRKRRWKKDGA